MVKVLAFCAAVTVGMFTYLILLSLWVAQGHAEASYLLKWELATLLAMMVTFTLSISEAVGAGRVIDDQAKIINAYDEAVAEAARGKLESQGIESPEPGEAAQA